jgi:hypothetical protein
MKLPWALGFAHYFRLSGFAARLDELLGRASFGPLRDAVATPLGAA